MTPMEMILSKVEYIKISHSVFEGFIAYVEYDRWRKMNMKPDVAKFTADTLDQLYDKVLEWLKGE